MAACRAFTRPSQSVDPIDASPGESLTRMRDVVHLSVAIGRFFEALLFALARSVGLIAVVAVAALTALLLAAGVARAAWRRRRRR